MVDTCHTIVQTQNIQHSKVNPNVNYGLLRIMMCQCRSSTVTMQHSGEWERFCVFWDKSIRELSVLFAPFFTPNLKLL